MKKERKLTQFDEGFGEETISTYNNQNKKKKKKNQFEKLEKEIITETDYQKQKGMSRFMNKKRDKNKYDKYEDWN